MDTHPIPGLQRTASWSQRGRPLRGFGNGAVWLVAALFLGHSSDLRAQAPVHPIDDGFPRYPVATVETQFATLWRQRAQHPYVCLVGQVAADAGAGTYVQVDSLRVADEPWATCNDPDVMGMVKLVDEVPDGTTLEAWGETTAQQLVAVALRQPNWRIIGVMFATVTATMPDAAAASPTDGPSLQRSLVPAFLWWPRTAENVRVLDELSGRADSAVPPERLRTEYRTPI